jgi:ribonuclease HII
LRDSKKLSARRREELAALIREHALAWSIARASVAEIDQLNILQASLLAMHRAVQGLVPQPQYVLVDGNRLPRWNYASEPVIKGDDRVPAIAAASILAKVQRDGELQALEQQYPGYGFAAHKGYPTAAHLQALRELGVTPVHRRSFAPVKKLLSGA